MASRIRARPTRPPRPDLALYVATATLLILGMAVMASIGEARTNLGRGPHRIFTQHLFAVVLGMLLCLLGALVRPTWWKQLIKPFLVASLVGLLLAVLPRFGLTIEGLHVVRNGASRWLRLGTITVMPGELFKLTFIVWLATYLSLDSGPLAHERAPRYPLAIAGAAFALLVLQPAISTAFTIAALTGVMLWLADCPLPRLRTLCTVAMLAAGIVLATSWPRRADAGGTETVAPEALANRAPEGSWGYVRERMHGYVPPWSWAPRRLGYHSFQSLVALGFGGAWGQGLGKGRHSYGRLPESHTDYPFAAIGEELGFLGTTTVVAAWGVILVRGIMIARNAPDLYHFLLASGLTLNLVLVAILNASVVTALVPVTGQGMPFVSYGGNAMLTSFFSIGVLDAVNRRSA